MSIVLRSSTLRRQLRRAIGQRPVLYLPLRNWRKPGTVVTATTDLVIEGFPRCGNTWTEQAIRHCAPDTIALAHHTHTAAHVKAALKRDVPVLLLFREPDAAVRSLLVLRGGAFSASEAMADYRTFYQSLAALDRDRVVWASFEAVTQRTGALIATLARRFGLPLRPYNDTEDERQEVFARMDETARLRRGDGVAKSRSHPTHRVDASAQLRADADIAVHASQAAAARAGAWDVFHRLVSDI